MLKKKLGYLLQEIQHKREYEIQYKTWICCNKYFRTWIVTLYYKENGTYNFFLRNLSSQNATNKIPRFLIYLYQ
jgi:hypothetical protein